MPRDAARLPVMQGTLDLLILKTLHDEPLHGYGITQAIRTRSGARLQVETGSLYPALHRLEKRGWVRADWLVSANNQRTRVYRLSPAGRRHLTKEHSRWEEFSKAVAAVLAPGASHGES
jgi:PadR family transcriptional regulator, regulatory protein PadR